MSQCNVLRKVSRPYRDIFSIFFKMKVCCYFSLELLHRGDSNEYTQYTCTIFNIKMKISVNYSKSAAVGFFLGTQELARNSRGKRAIGVRAIEVLLYFRFNTDLLNNKPLHLIRL